MSRWVFWVWYVEGGIRTHTPYGATPSRWCVCQFRHFRTGRLRFVILAARLADGKRRCATCLLYGFFGCAGAGGGNAGGFCVEPAGDCFVELAGALAGGSCDGCCGAGCLVTGGVCDFPSVVPRPGGTHFGSRLI